MIDGWLHRLNTQTDRGFLRSRGTAQGRLNLIEVHDYGTGKMRIDWHDALVESGSPVHAASAHTTRMSGIARPLGDTLVITEPPRHPRRSPMLPAPSLPVQGNTTRNPTETNRP